MATCPGTGQHPSAPFPSDRAKGLCCVCFRITTLREDGTVASHVDRRDR